MENNKFYVMNYNNEKQGQDSISKGGYDNVGSYDDIKDAIKSCY